MDHRPRLGTSGVGEDTRASLLAATGAVGGALAVVRVDGPDGVVADATGELPFRTLTGVDERVFVDRPADAVFTGLDTRTDVDPVDVDPVLIDAEEARLVDTVPDTEGGSTVADGVVTRCMSGVLTDVEGARTGVEPALIDADGALPVETDADTRGAVTVAAGASSEAAGVATDADGVRTEVDGALIDAEGAPLVDTVADAVGVATVAAGAVSTADGVLTANVLEPSGAAPATAAAGNEKG